MTLTHEPQALEATGLIAQYVLVDARVKRFTTTREEMKPAVLAALDAVGGSIDVGSYKVTKSSPTTTQVDLVVLKETTNSRLFNKLTNRTPNLEAIRHYLGAEKLSDAAKAAITEEPSTPQIRITPQ